MAEQVATIEHYQETFKRGECHESREQQQSGLSQYRDLLRRHGNEFGDENSNVVELYATLVINEEQLGYYHPGVGTMGSPKSCGRLEKEWTRATGILRPHCTIL